MYSAMDHNTLNQRLIHSMITLWLAVALTTVGTVSLMVEAGLACTLTGIILLCISHIFQRQCIAKVERRQALQLRQDQQIEQARKRSRSDRKPRVSRDSITAPTERYD